MAILAAGMLFLLPIDWAKRQFTLNWNQASRIDWGTILLFGAGIALVNLATDPASFWQLVSTPRKSAERVGRAFGEYLKRALTQSVALREPKDLAWFLASYARDALERVETMIGLG